MRYQYASKTTTNLSNRGVHLETRVRCDEKGLLTIDLHTWATGLKGAHATHDVLILDEFGNELWRMPTVVLGVAGKAEFWNRRNQNRRSIYTQQLPKAVAREIDGVVIQHGNRDQSAFLEWLDAHWDAIARFVISVIETSQVDETRTTPEGAAHPAETLAKYSKQRATRAMRAAEYAKYESLVRGGELPARARQGVAA